MTIEDPVYDPREAGLGIGGGILGYIATGAIYRVYNEKPQNLRCK